MKVFHDIYDNLITPENLLIAWKEFKKGKIKKKDVLEFERNLEDNIFRLYDELKNKTYRHRPYQTFHIYDPKYRIINKATVRDRLVHHLIFNQLYPIFNPTFIYHSYASRLDKGTHLGVQNLTKDLRKVSKNYTESAYALKCDVQKFFHSVSHQKLLQIIENKIKDNHFLWLMHEIIESFKAMPAELIEREREREREREHDCGIPIGNLTSQIFANIYLNELDQFIKQKLKIKHYFRYADDFIIAHHNEKYLKSLIPQIENFLNKELLLKLHPHKIEVRKLRQGIDFLGYVILPHHIVLRTKTKRRIRSKLSQKQISYLNGSIDYPSLYQGTQSYLGILSHCDAHDLSNDIKNNFL